MKLLLTYFWKRLPIGDLISLTRIALAFSKSSQIGPSSSNHLKSIIIFTVFTTHEENFNFLSCKIILKFYCSKFELYRLVQHFGGVLHQTQRLTRQRSYRQIRRRDRNCCPAHYTSPGKREFSLSGFRILNIF